jgi:hypothetical protein
VVSILSAHFTVSKMENKFNGSCLIVAAIIIAAAILWNGQVGRYQPVNGQVPGMRIDTATGNVFH